jgi:hypothetical protein
MEGQTVLTVVYFGLSTVETSILQNFVALVYMEPSGAQWTHGYLPHYRTTGALSLIACQMTSSLKYCCDEMTFVLFLFFAGDISKWKAHRN